MSVAALFEVDLHALEDVAQALSLTWPIKVVIKMRPLLMNGYEDPSYGGVRRFRANEHLIELAGNRSPQQANHNLLHELAHCQQAEVYGDDWVKAYRATPDVFEVEAERFATKAAATWTVVVATGSNKPQITP